MTEPILSCAPHPVWPTPVPMCLPHIDRSDVYRPADYTGHRHDLDAWWAYMCYRRRRYRINELAKYGITPVTSPGHFAPWSGLSETMG